MILHPEVIANLLASYAATFMVIYATFYGVQILRRWDIRSGDELQLALERKTYLISTVLTYVFALQLFSIFLYVFTADALCPLFVGAMCAAGTLNVNAFGYPTLLIKILTFMLAGLWLILNHADNQGYDYPLIKKKYSLLAFIVPFMILETILESAYFLGLKADVITSCCGSLFSIEREAGLGFILVSLPERAMAWIFYVSMLCTLTCGIFFYRRGRGGYLYSILSAMMFVVSIISIVSFISPYVYELPTHHCPFCIVMREYHYIGYFLYMLLFTAAVCGIGTGALLPFRGVQSLTPALGIFIRRLAIASTGSYAAFTAIVTCEIASSNLMM